MPNYSGLDDQPCHPRPSPGEPARNSAGQSLEYIPCDEYIPFDFDVDNAPSSLEFFEYEKCAKCGAYLGLSITILGDGQVIEWKVRRPRPPDVPSRLGISGGGIFCEKCGTHVTEAEEIAERSSR